MKHIKLFEDFIPMGFGSNNSASFSLSGTRNIGTGYDMNVIVGPVQQLGNHIATEAGSYEKNDNPGDLNLVDFLAILRVHNIIIGNFMRKTGLSLTGDERDHVLDGLEFLGLIVRDFHVEFLLKSHDQLDGVEGVRAEVFDKFGFRCDLVGADAELIHDDILYPFFDRFI